MLTVVANGRGRLIGVASVGAHGQTPDGGAEGHGATCSGPHDVLLSAVTVGCCACCEACAGGQCTAAGTPGEVVCGRWSDCWGHRAAAASHPHYSCGLLRPGASSGQGSRGGQETPTACVRQLEGAASTSASTIAEACPCLGSALQEPAGAGQVQQALPDKQPQSMSTHGNGSLDTSQPCSAGVGGASVRREGDGLLHARKRRRRASSHAACSSCTGWAHAHPATSARVVPANRAWLVKCEGSEQVRE